MVTKCAPEHRPDQEVPSDRFLNPINNLNLKIGTVLAIATLIAKECAYKYQPSIYVKLGHDGTEVEGVTQT